MEKSTNILDLLNKELPNLSKVENKKLLDKIHGSIEVKPQKDTRWYAFRFCYKDGSAKDHAVNGKIETMFYDFDGLLDWEEYDSLPSKNLTAKDILKMAFNLYRKSYGNYIRVEIIRIATNEIIDYIDEDEMKK